MHVGCAPLAAFALCVGRVESAELQRKRRIRRLFDRFDVQNRGYLTPDSFRQVIFDAFDHSGGSYLLIQLLRFDLDFRNAKCRNRSIHEAVRQK